MRANRGTFKSGKGDNLNSVPGLKGFGPLNDYLEKFGGKNDRCGKMPGRVESSH